MTPLSFDNHRPVLTTEFEYPQEQDEELDQIYYWQDHLQRVVSLLRGNGSVEDITLRCLSFVFTLAPQVLNNRHLLRGLALQSPSISNELNGIPQEFRKRIARIAYYFGEVRYINSFTIRAVTFLFVFRGLPELRNQVSLAKFLKVGKPCISQNVEECRIYFGLRTKKNSDLIMRATMK